MVKLPKSIIKKYGITKKAWAVFRGTKSGRKAKAKRAAPAKRRKSPKRARRSVAASTTKESGGSIMARRKRSKGKKRAPGVRRRHARRVAGRIVGSGPAQMLTGAATMTAGAVVTSLAINKIPTVNTLSPNMKSGLQMALGALGMLFMKNKHVKLAGTGSFIAGAMGLTKKLLNVDPMAGSGDARTLSHEELYRLQRGQMGVPAQVRMGVPAQVRMGVPAQVKMGGSAESGWGMRN